MFADGATNYNQTILFSTDKLIGQGRDNVTQVMLFLSDGLPTVPNSKGNTGGTTDPEDIASAIDATNYAVANNIPIITVGFGNNTNFDESLLKLMANMTGGFYHRATSSDSLQSVFDALLGEVCTFSGPECGNGVVEEGEECELPN